MPTTLLVSKIHRPRPRPGNLRRDHLLQRLQEGLKRGRQLTLVSAPAGFGKTTLIAEWAAGMDRPLAWLSLDGADSDPARFLQYLLAAMKMIAPSVGEQVAQQMESDRLLKPDLVLTHLINDLMLLEDDCVLVMDDYHLIDDECVHELLRMLVEHQPPCLHLVIITREDPPLLLARLRGRGLITEIRAVDLRFSDKEVADFLRSVMGLALEMEDTRKLAERTEGWITGLQLAGLSMQERENPAALIENLTGSHYYILGYLTEEVLGQLDEDVQGFLLRTSILDQMNGALCDAVTAGSDGKAMLARLDAMNLFVIALDDAHEWFRYHHLFAELLRNQLERSEIEPLAVLHRRAAGWYEKNGNVMKAVDHLLAVGEYGSAISLLDEHAMSILMGGHLKTVERWLNMLPETWRKSGLRVNFSFAWVLALQAQYVRAKEYVALIEDALQDPEMGMGAEEKRALVGEMNALRSVIAHSEGKAVNSKQYALQAIEQTPTENVFVQGLAHLALGGSYRQVGDVVQAVPVYRKAVNYCQQAGLYQPGVFASSSLAVMLVLAGRLQEAFDVLEAVEKDRSRYRLGTDEVLGTIYSGLGALYLAWNEVGTAFEYLEKALSMGRESGHRPTVVYTLILLSKMYAQSGDEERAGEALDEASALMGEGVPAWIKPIVLAWQMTWLAWCGDYAAAMAILTDHGVSTEAAVSYEAEELLIAAARAEMCWGRAERDVVRLQKAVALTERLEAVTREGGRNGRLSEVLVVRVLAYAALEAYEQALDGLAQVLTLAAKEGEMRLFLQEGEAMRQVLKRYLKERGQTGEYSEFVNKVLAAFSATGKEEQREAFGKARAGNGLLDLLTERELEVLRLMAVGRTYQEIGEQLFVSVNTVRSHVKSIYGKLGVNKATLAVEMARQANLL